MSRHRILIVPGWNNSGPGHWQSVWQDENPEYERVEQRDWHHASVHAWVGTLHEAIVSSTDAAVLVAHSLGCLTIAWWAHLFPQHVGRVAAALLVAPPDLESPRCRPESLRRFTPAPRKRLPFPSFVVGSENDPYMSLKSARQLAGDWGSGFVNAGRAGHINAESGLRRWPEGRRLLEHLDAIAASDGYHRFTRPCVAAHPVRANVIETKVIETMEQFA